MRFILLSDFHLVVNNPSSRIDNLLEYQFKKLAFILMYARKYKCVVLQAGDFSEVPRSWFLLPRLATFFTAFKDVDFYGVFGQHDTYLYSELTRDATTLGVLNKTGLIHILDRKPTIVDNCKLYGCSFGTKVPKVRKEKGFHNVLVIHDHISDKALFSHHKYRKAESYLLRKKRFRLILAGDIHRKFKVKKGKRRIVNTGPIIRTSNTDYNRRHRPGFYVWNSQSNKIKWVEIPHETTEEVFLNKVETEALSEQTHMIRAIDEIKKTDQYTVQARLGKVLVDMYDEFSVADEVQDLLADLLS